MNHRNQMATGSSARPHAPLTPVHAYAAEPVAAIFGRGQEMMTEISFNVSNADAQIIRRIAERAQKLFERFGVNVQRADIAMDITAVHANGTPLKLMEMLGSGNGDFSHDIGGIRQHLDRETGKLRNGFLPRFAV